MQRKGDGDGEFNCLVKVEELIKRYFRRNYLLKETELLLLCVGLGVFRRWL